MSNLSTATKNPPVLFNKAEIRRRIFSPAAGRGSALPRRFCTGLNSFIASWLPIWEAETSLIPH